MFTIRSTHRLYQTLVIRSRIVSISSEGYAIDPFLRSFHGKESDEEIRRRFDAVSLRFAKRIGSILMSGVSLAGREGRDTAGSEITEEWHTYVSRERFLE